MGMARSGRCLSSGAQTAKEGAMFPPKVKLYQYASCPFCNKAQTYMEWHGIEYEKIEVNPLSKKEMSFSTYKKVPFAMIDGRQVNGSGTIIDELCSMGALKGGKNGPNGTAVAKWCNWVDDHLVHLLPPNIYRTPSESIQAFEYITTTSGNFSKMEMLSIKYVGALAMFFVAKGSQKKYNLGPDARQDLFKAVQVWTKEGLQGRRFHSGDSFPDMADLAVFGVLRSIDGNYETWKDLVKHDFEGKEHFWGWYHTVKSQVAQNRSPGAQVQ